MRCLLKSVSCTDNQNESQGQGQSQNENQNEPTENQPNNTTGSAPNINYSEALYPLFRNFSISTITPTVTGTVTSCSSNPALPSGLSLHPTSCTITGTPTTLQSATSYAITATNQFGFETKSISIAITNLVVSQVYMSLLPGNYNSNQNVTLTSGTSGATIYYTTDGTTPKTSVSGSTSMYSSAISVTVSQTIRAIAVKSGYANSSVGSATYTINGTGAYSVGGWVSGLQGMLSLQNTYNDDSLTLSGNGPFHFGKPLANGVSFTVTIPTTSGQSCRVDVDDGGVNKGGTISGNYLTVSVVCDGDIIAASSKTNYTSTTVSGGYLVTDNDTGLIWKKCAQEMTDPSCTFVGGGLSWINHGISCYQLNNGTGYGGRKDWRLPTVNELASLMTSGNPSINTTYFGTPYGGAFFRAATTDGGNSVNAYGFATSGGSMYSNLIKSGFNNRWTDCVAGP